MKKIYKFSAIATFAVAMLCGTACQEEEEVKVSNVCNNTENTSFRDSIIGYINFDTTRKCISKKSHYSEESSVFVYDRNGKTGSTYKTIKLMSKDMKIIQEWFVEYLHSNCVSDYTICGLDPNGSKYGYFYKWKGDLYQMNSEDFMIAKTKSNNRYYRLPENMKVKGFRLPSTKDISQLDSLYTNLADANFELQFNMYDRDFEFTNYCKSTGEGLTKRMWVLAGLYANENTDEYGMSVMIPSGDFRDERITLYTSNNPDELCRIRLMRTLTLEQWEEEE
jgi:hypothetical protein